jgi:nucleotide-binding universal stress UspA family protein
MITIKTILVPIDFSDASTAALGYARALAEAFESALHLLHVVQDPYVQPWAAEAFGVSLAGVLERWERDARGQLEGLVPEAERGTRTVECATRVGHPFVEILDYAAAHQADLIVMGTHGRGPVAHMLLGSVTEKVIRKAPCPVLTVRPKPR